ncbi:hypothetical protein [Cytobacillus praedii]|nr:hypothetical protein [Cytobacillus praedii]
MKRAILMEEEYQEKLHAMPEMFKGIFTCNDKGDHIQLIPPAVSTETD